MKTPQIVIFFPNGMTAVCDKNGEQIGELQGRHAYTVKKLKELGYSLDKIPEVFGSPNLDTEIELKRYD